MIMKDRKYRREYERKVGKKHISRKKAGHLETRMTRPCHEFAWLINLFINTKQEKILVLLVLN